MASLTRSSTDKLIGGVCGGIAKQLNFDPTLTRIILGIAIVVTNGVGVLAYLAAWALIPDETGKSMLGDVFKSKSSEKAPGTLHSGWPADDTASDQKQSTYQQPDWQNKN